MTEGQTHSGHSLRAQFISGLKTNPDALPSYIHAHSGHAGHHDEHQRIVEDYRRRFFFSVLFTIPVFFFSPLLWESTAYQGVFSFKGSHYLLLGLSSLLYFYGGWPFLKGMYYELRYTRPGMMTLIALAMSVAYVYSNAVIFGMKGSLLYTELATLVDIMLLGHWIELKSLLSAGEAVHALTKLIPSSAHKITVGANTIEVPISSLVKGDFVLVRPGEKIPADGIVREGSSEVNEALLTGESRLIMKQKGSKVLGGSINNDGSLAVEVTGTGEDTFISRVIAMVAAAQADKSTTQTLADQAAFYLTMFALVAGFITYVVWIMAPVGTFEFGVERMVAVMVATCPHALGLAIPLVIAVSTAMGAQRGLLIRRRNAFEEARNIQAIIFDKTGTLTEGNFGVKETLIIRADMSEQDVLAYAASVEQHSEHLLARAIVKASPTLWPVSDFKSIPGKGAEGMVKGQKVQVISPLHLRELAIHPEDTQVKALQARGRTVVYVLVDGKVAGAVALADMERRESAFAIAKLKKMGIHCIMMTGDDRSVAESMAADLGIDEVLAEVLPNEKAAKVKEIQARGLKVAMVGDGVNDAPALAQADVGIAIGAGTDVAMETADVILVKSNPFDIVSLIVLARKTYRKMVQNLVLAISYNLFAIPAAAGAFLAFGVILSPAIGALLMSLSTAACALNARLLQMPTLGLTDSDDEEI